MGHPLESDPKYQCCCCHVETFAAIISYIGIACSFIASVTVIFLPLEIWKIYLPALGFIISVVWGVVGESLLGHLFKERDSVSEDRFCIVVAVVYAIFLTTVFFFMPAWYIDAIRRDWLKGHMTLPNDFIQDIKLASGLSALGIFVISAINGTSWYIVNRAFKYMKKYG
ncbi:hypothetical protein Ddc_11595 [Ditylenchus destructor]|nr:hypothetical protein Ddc_11595 [Ditylenchus destructor]